MGMEKNTKSREMVKVERVDAVESVDAEAVEIDEPAAARFFRFVNILVQKTKHRSKCIKQRTFLLAFVESYGQVARSAAIAKVDRTTPHKWLAADDPAYMDAWSAASDLMVERMEQEVRRRAMEGNRRYRFTTKGEPIMDPRTNEQYYDDVPSDLLAIFYLKAAKPDKYRDYTGPQSTTIIGKSITLHNGPSTN